MFKPGQLIHSVCLNDVGAWFTGLVVGVETTALGTELYKILLVNTTMEKNVIVYASIYDLQENYTTTTIL